MWVLPEIAPKIGDYVAVFAFFNHIDFLLYQRKVISWKTGSSHGYIPAKEALGERGTRADNS